ncbi:enhancer of mRNA decapping [Diatrype stigma]|uniref:Enhancer of mRNA-decapping protein 3 n=1 Tax=Diatrype stigma TaxID=117547 RepID=A0AAN9UQQ5_9PEZI
MADTTQWLRKSVVVTLQPPSNELIQGTISALVPRERITLDNAVLLRTRQLVGRIEISATQISDLKVLYDQYVVPVLAPITSDATVTAPPPASAVSAAASNAAPKTTFQDPAIVSVGRRSRSESSQTSISTRLPNTAEKRDPPVPNPADVMSFSSPDESDTTTVPTLNASIGQLALDPTDPTRLDTTEDEETQDQSTIPTTQPAARTKRSRNRNRKKERNGENKDTVASAETSAARSNQGKGWRQTPMLQSTKSFQPFASLKKVQKGKAGQTAANGWASEDVMDVQEAGDFDFQEGLAKFDKRSIFDEMKAQDDIDEAQRLVSHNRIPRPKPGTAGGKNFHYSENVLDIPSPANSTKIKDTPDDFWKSEADDGNIVNNGDKHSGQEGSGRTSRLRGESRVSTTRRSQSRKASATVVSGGVGRVNSGFGSTVNLSGLYIMPINRRVETVTHLQMLVAENVAQNDFGFTEDLMAENAGRGISLVAVKALEDPALILQQQAAAASNTSPATIVILAGNNKSGSRAIAAGRHLRNHGLTVLVCVIGIEREAELLEDLRKQIRLFRNFGGNVYTKSELFEHLSKNATSLKPASHLPVTLVIDALLGLTISFEELRMSDQATTYELMEWANRIEAFVMSIDIPSGIEPSSGKICIIDGVKLYIRPRWIVSLGAPKQGLLKALEMGVADTEWVLYLADIGLGSIWRKTSTKIRRGIDFDGNWLLEMRYQSQA